MGSRFDRTQYLHVSHISRQNNDARISKLAAKSDQRIETIHFRHLQIHQRDIWTMCAKLLDTFASICSLRHDPHVGLTAYESFYPFTNHGMIVYHQNPNGIRVAAHDSIPPCSPKNFSASHERRRGARNFAYACAPGILNSTSVPDSNPPSVLGSELHNVSLPPTRSARSRMPRNPKWPARPCSASSFDSMPFPSSRTRNRNCRSS